MDKYLLEILKDVNTIIIPGLGALTITNIDTGEIMFMGFLKHDDGQLSKYIAEKESWDENEAKNLIAKYVREITLKLDQGESYDMYEFGSFVKNEDGEIEFRNWEQGDSSKTDDSKTEIKSEPEVPESEIKEEIEEESEKEVIESPVVIPASETEKVEESKEEIEQEESAEPTKVEVKAEEPESKKADATEEKKEEKPKPVVAAAVKKDLTIIEREAIKKGEGKLERLRKQKEEQN